MKPSAIDSSLDFKIFIMFKSHFKLIIQHESFKEIVQPMYFHVFTVARSSNPTFFSSVYRLALNA